MREQKERTILSWQEFNRLDVLMEFHTGTGFVEYAIQRADLEKVKQIVREVLNAGNAMSSKGNAFTVADWAAALAFLLCNLASEYMTLVVSDEQSVAAEEG